jgi:hypothetical protein
METEETRVLTIESVTEGGSTLVLIYLEGGISSPNPDTTEGCKYNSATVPYLEFYSPKYSLTPDLTRTNKYLLKRIKHYQEIWVEVIEGVRNVCWRLRRKLVYTTNSGYRQNPTK